jgi:hypothetical protein
MTDHSFEQRYRRIEGLINGGQLREASMEAANFATATDQARALFLLNLIVNITNWGVGAGSDRLVDWAHKCSDATPEILGDMKRDQAIGLIRFRGHGGRDAQADLDAASLLLSQVQERHQNDPNRMACLQGVRGRLAFAYSSYDAAIAHHREADLAWANLGQQQNLVWRYLNLVQWLRATVALQGHSSTLARQLAMRIQNECPQGFPPHTRPLQLLMTPCGLRLYRYAETHRR